MATPSKTIPAAALKAISILAANLHDHSSELDVSTTFAVRVFIDFARDSASAMTEGVRFHIQVAEKETGNDGWRSVCPFVTNFAAPASIVTDGAEAAGQSVIECGTTVPALDSIVFFENATLANSEWARVVERVITGGAETFTLADGLTNDQAQGTYYNAAEQYSPVIDVSTAKRLRVICISSNQAIIWQVRVITLDSIG